MMGEFWNTSEAVARNRRDWVLKELEKAVIASFVKDGDRVLDVGCGDGETLEALARDFSIDGYGLEKSPVMYEQARLRAVSGEPRKGTFSVVPGDVVRLLGSPFVIRQRAPYDLIYTERCLINLPDWSAQRRAIQDICSLLKPGARYVMVEHSQDGLDETNALRASLGLPAIQVPDGSNGQPANRYLRDDEIAAFAFSSVQLMADMAAGKASQDFWLDAQHDFAGTYYFLSRIVNAKLASDLHVAPDYNSPINRLALDLPLGLGPGGFRGYSRAWVWRKA